jgi:cytoskeletal protein CcmA (bactofilin family)
MIGGFDTPGPAGSGDALNADLTEGFGGAPTSASVASPAGTNNEVASYLNASTFFKGLLKSNRSVGIDGQFEGEIQCEADVVIGRDAEVRANVKAGTVIVSGRIVGNISCATLEIQSAGRVIGNVTAESMLIAMGAVFRGQSFMGSEEDAAELPEPLQQQRPSTSRRRSSSAATTETAEPEAEAEAEAEAD